ncbi:MAG: siroheme synthase CysG [Woeseiaceae bacterium]|nr:siroheme synthase CysG [Woeseiaceae bacterium]
MDYFPAFLNLADRPCLLVGGGEIAARKARLLLAAGARLTVVAPALDEALAGQLANHRGTHIAREFDAGDVDGHWLVVSATDDPGVQRRVADAANRARIFCNAVDSLPDSSYITPAIVDRGPLVIGISTGGAAPVLARIIRTRLEALLPASLGRLAALASRWREAVGAALPELAVRRRFWERVFDGPVAAAVEANDTAGAERELSAALTAAGAGASGRGQAWLVGAGPGDPGLLTLRALQVLGRADVIVHDRLVSADVLDLARRDAERIAVGKTPGAASCAQEDINALLVELVASGRRVCRLKGGDPFVFGRGGEEAAALAAAGLPCEIVPGITAAVGCAASAGIPLTHRDAAQSVVLVTGHGKASVDRLDWASLARDRQTLAFYMAVRRFTELMQNLIRHGRPADTPVAIVENGTRPEQRVVTGRLGQLAVLAEAHRIASPAMLFVGEVAGLRIANIPAAEPPVAPADMKSAIQTVQVV